MTDDPMDGAAVGETRTLTHEVDIYPVDYEPREWFGDDRNREQLRIADTEAVTDEYGDEQLRVTFAADVTKQLPESFDTVASVDSVTPPEPTLWDRVPTEVVPVLVGIGVSGAVGYTVMGSLSNAATINGEPVTAPSPMAMIIMMALIGIVYLALVFVARSWEPGVAA